MIVFVYLSSAGFFLCSYLKVLIQLPWRKKSNCNISRVFIYSRSYVLFNPLSKQDVCERESHSDSDSYFSQWNSCAWARLVNTKNSSTKGAFLGHFHYSHDAAPYITRSVHVIPPSAVHTDASRQQFPQGTVVPTVLKAKSGWRHWFFSMGKARKS